MFYLFLINPIKSLTFTIFKRNVILLDIIIMVISEYNNVMSNFFNPKTSKTIIKNKNPIFNIYFKLIVKLNILLHITI